MTEPDKAAKADDEPEVIKDLDVDERKGDDVRGGHSLTPSPAANAGALNRERE